MRFQPQALTAGVPAAAPTLGGAAALEPLRASDASGLVAALGTLNLADLMANVSDVLCYFDIPYGLIICDPALAGSVVRMPHVGDPHNDTMRPPT